MDKYICICPRCKEEYKSENTKRKLCPKCKKIKLLRYTKKCLYCKKEFKTNNKDAVYCSSECSNKAKIKKVKISCKNCGKKKEFNLSEKKAFCSQRCYRLYFLNKKRKHIKNKERISLKDEMYKKIKFIFNYQCFLCKKKPDNINNILVVHHIDKKPYNNKINNFCLLCNKCHNLVHHNKEIDMILKSLANNFYKSYTYKVRRFLSNLLV